MENLLVKLKAGSDLSPAIRHGLEEGYLNTDGSHLFIQRGEKKKSPTYC